MKKPRQFSLVKLRADLDKSMSKDLPFMDDLPLVFLGEIPNMPEHGIFAGHRSGRIYSGFHIFEFVELSEDEV